MKSLLSVKKHHLISLILLNILAVAAITYVARLVGQFTDAMLDTTQGFDVAYIYLAVAVPLIIFYYACAIATIWLVINVTFEARIGALSQKLKTAKSWETVWNEMEVWNAYVYGIVNAFFTLLPLIAAVVVLFITSWMIGLVALVGFVYVAFLPRLFSKRIEALRKERLEVQNDYRKKLDRLSENYPTLSLDGKEMLDMTNKEVDQFEKLSIRVDLLNMWRKSIAKISLGLIGVLILVEAALLIYYDLATLGVLVTASSLFALFALNVTNITSHLADVKTNKWITKAKEEFDYQYDDITAPSSPVQEIKAEGVTKSVLGRMLLRPIAMRVKINESIIITGPNGAGKTTLARIIAGIDKEYEGAISVDGTPQKPYMSESIMYQTSATTLIPGTVRENIVAFATSGVDEALVQKLASDLHMEDLLEREVANLSAGQVALVKVAMMLYVKVSIRVFDEIFANIDVHSRDAVISYALSKGGINIVIAHHDIAHEFDHHLALTKAIS